MLRWITDVFVTVTPNTFSWPKLMLQGCLEMFDKQVQFILGEIRDESGTLWHRIPFA